MRLVSMALILASAAVAQEPRSASAGLEPAIQSILSTQSAPAWVAYSVPIVAGSHQSCDGRNGVVKLEGATELTVLLRVENNRIGKVRTLTPDCEIDSGGLPLYWLKDVRASDSVRYLYELGKTNEQAVFALSQIKDPEALPAVIRLAREATVQRVRKRALFWLARSKDPRAQSFFEEVLLSR